MDFSKYSVSELKEFQEQIKKQIVARQDEDLNKARQEIMLIAQRVGVPVTELVGNLTRQTRISKGTKTTVAPRYRNPADASQQWTGRGRQPNWVKEWVESGKSLDETAIKNQE